MRTTREDPMIAFFISIGIALAVVLGGGVLAASATEKALDELTIQVTIEKRSFHVTGYGREGDPMAIVVRNDDGVTHGFYSPLFKETPVRLEGEGYQVTGPSFIRM